MLALGFILGSAATWVMCGLLYRSMRADERWWQGSEYRRNFYWPVLPDETAGTTQEGDRDPH